jgi:hypothetical protein
MLIKYSVVVLVAAEEMDYLLSAFPSLAIHVTGPDATLQPAFDY